jgi:hypothetical protein
MGAELHILQTYLGAVKLFYIFENKPTALNTFEQR